MFVLFILKFYFLILSLSNPISCIQLDPTILILTTKIFTSFVSIINLNWKGSTTNKNRDFVEPLTKRHLYFSSRNIGGDQVFIILFSHWSNFKSLLKIKLTLEKISITRSKCLRVCKKFPYFIHIIVKHFTESCPIDILV